MKKIALSIAISSIVATGASAATVLEQDGFKLDVQGDIQIQLLDSPSENDELLMDYDDAEIKFKPVYTFDNGLEAFGSVEIESGVSSDSYRDDAYVGLRYQGLSFQMGDYYLASDGFGVGQDIEFGATDTIEVTNSTEALRGAYSNANLTVSLTHDLDEADDGAITELFASYTVDAINFQGIVQFQDAAVTAASDDVVSYGISAAYTQDLYTIGAEFTGSDSDAKETAFEVAGTFAATDMITFGAGVGSVSGDDEQVDYYVNGMYSLNSNVAAFAELGGNDTDDSELGYLLGMKVTF